MSDTPRTDSQNKWVAMDQSTLRFARKLERELNEANERVKRLEEAGDAMYHYCDAASRFGWKQAKETKP